MPIAFRLDTSTFTRLSEAASLSGVSFRKVEGLSADAGSSLTGRVRANRFAVEPSRSHAGSAPVDSVVVIGRRAALAILHDLWSKGLADGATTPNPWLRYGGGIIAAPQLHLRSVSSPMGIDTALHYGVTSPRQGITIRYQRVKVGLFSITGDSVFIGSDKARRQISVRRSDWQKYSGPEEGTEEAKKPERKPSATRGKVEQETEESRKRQAIRDALRHVLRPSADTVLASALEAGLQIPEGMQIWDFQRQGIAWIVESASLISDLEDDPRDRSSRMRHGRLIADEMGMGKTIQAIAALVYLVRDQKVRHAIVVAPKSVVRQWKKELEVWGPQLKVTEISGSATTRAAAWKSDAHVSIVSYESFARDYIEGSDEGPRGREWDLVIADEAQKIKNPKAEKSRELKLLPRKLSWALTGTPVENKTFDIVSIFQFVCGDPELFSGRREDEVGPDDEEVAEIRARVMLRRRLDDHIGGSLPELTRRDIPVELGSAQQHEYDACLAEAQEGLESFEGAEEQFNFKAYGYLVRLLQICNSTIDGPPESTKTEVIAEEIEEIIASGRKALVFSKFRSGQAGIDALAERLRGAGIRTAVFHGGTPQTERSRLSIAFGPPHQRTPEMNAIADDEPRVLCLIFQAGATGLNLQGANYVFLFDPWWNPAVEAQAIGRAYRQGQGFPVTAMRLIATGTVEERVVEVVARKQIEAAQVVDYDREIDEQEHLDRLAQSLNSEDYRNIFGLSLVPRMASRTGRGAARDKKIAAAPDTRGVLPSGLEALGQSKGRAGAHGNWRDLEQQCLQAAIAIGWPEAALTPDGGDGGIDVIGSRPPGQGPELIGIQAKRWARRVGAEEVRKLHGVRDNWGITQKRSRLVLVSSAGFTRGAEEEARVYEIELWGPEEITQAVNHRERPLARGAK